MPDDFLTLSSNVAPNHEAGTYRRVTLDRTLKAGYSSLALPFNTTVQDIVGTGYNATTDWVAQLRIVTYNAKDGYSLYFQKSNNIVANEPYILHLGSAKSGVVFTNVEMVAATAVEKEATGGINGFADWKMVSNYALNFDMEDKYGVVNASECLKKGAAGSTLKAYTAYIIYNGAAPTQVKTAYLDEDEADAILELIRNQQEEMADQQIYDLQGRKLSRTQQGVNIIRQKDGTTKKVKY